MTDFLDPVSSFEDSVSLGPVGSAPGDPVGQAEFSSQVSQEASEGFWGQQLPPLNSQVDDSLAQAAQAGSSAANFGPPPGSGFTPAGGAKVWDDPFLSDMAIENSGVGGSNFAGGGGGFSNSPAGTGIGNSGFSNNSQGGFINGLIGSAANVFGGVVQQQTQASLAAAKERQQAVTLRYVLIGGLIIGGIFLLVSFNKK